MDTESNPLALDREAAELLRRRKLDVRAAEARSTTEWFDIFQEIVFGGVQSILEDHGQGSDVSGKLADIRPACKAVREAFAAQGLDLNEDIDWEGPVPVIDPQSQLCMGLEWPNGQEVTFIWPTKETIRFRGQKALVATCFMMWWSNFQPTLKHMQGKSTEGERRLIEPGSPEWLNYMKGRPQG